MNYNYPNYQMIIDSILLFSAINFFLYCAAGKKFRTDLMALFRGRKKGSEHSNSSTGTLKHTASIASVETIESSTV